MGRMKKRSNLSKGGVTHYNIAVVLRYDHMMGLVVLLGKKKDGDKIGAGKWTALGGKRERRDKSPKHGAQRETRQECGIRIPLNKFRFVGIIHGFKLKDGEEEVPVAYVRVYVAYTKTDEFVMEKKAYSSMGWFKMTMLPDGMMRGDRDWLFKIIFGRKLNEKVILNNS